MADKTTGKTTRKATGRATRKATGGAVAIRGFLVQTLIGLLESLSDTRAWKSVTLEPKVNSDKVDILWEYKDGKRKAVQVKSSQNPFAKADIEEWATELEKWKQADEYELQLVGTLGSPSVASVSRVGKVAIPFSKNLDLGAFKAQAAHHLACFLESQKLRTGNSHYREMMVDCLVGKLMADSTTGDPLIRSKLISLLRDWIGAPESPKPTDTTVYLRRLLGDTAHIDIRGLQVGRGRAHQFPIEDLFISLSAGRQESIRGESVGKSLNESLRNDWLVIVGDPGAGKTTFLRRVAHALCATELGDDPDAAKVRLGITDKTFPILIRLSDLARHLARHDRDDTAPTGDVAPAWLPHFLAAASAANCWELDNEFFEVQLRDGICTILLDGLDEAPDRIMRQRLSQLIENLAVTYPGCRLVVTSRPAAYTGEVILPKFAHAQIDPLSDQAVETFLSRWCQSLNFGNPSAAREQLNDLIAALQARPEIRRMARNPVMLTALAVVHWNERRLPEQRADLYESTIRWLSRQREQRPGREKAERTVAILRGLALDMQANPDGLKLQVSKRWAAEKLAKEWAEPVDEKAIGCAEAFLDAEELDSGIIVGRGNEVRFWHRTFQEFLAARAIAARPEAGQVQLLWGPPARLYLPEWREVIMLLAGVLHSQGREKVDNLIVTMLERLGAVPSLDAQARCAGLLGGVLRDLATLDYEPPDGRYRSLLERVMAIFDPAGAERVPIDVRIAAADALGQAGDPRIDARRDDYWASIPDGKFKAGVQPGGPKKANYEKVLDHQPSIHEVVVDTYRIARYPITVGQYRHFLEDDGYMDKRWWQAGGFGRVSEPNDWEKQVEYPSRPVVSVSWFEAMAYCAWVGFRLPTEAEWERAARGTAGRKYPWGDEEPDDTRANCRNSLGHPTPVGVFPLGGTPEGVRDMAGNTWEWCEDWYGEYIDEGVSIPRIAVGVTMRVIRGGSWRTDAGLCRATIRHWDEPQDRVDDLGFRMAADPPGVQPKTGE